MNNILNWLTSRIKGDFQIWFIVLMLTVFSIMAVYSSSASLAFTKQEGNTEYYLFKHLGLIGLSLVLMYLAHRVNYIYYSRISTILLVICIPLLIYTAFFAPEVHGSRRWIMVFGVSFQTSDLAKLALIMFIARVLSKNQEKLNDFRSTFVPIAMATVVICSLIAPSNLSTSVILFVSCLMLMIIGRLYYKHLMVLMSGIVIAAAIFIVIAPRIGGADRTDTWGKRFRTYVNPSKSDAEDVYQANQAKIAIASGGIFGKMPGNSTQKIFLPYAYSDFIYAIIIEEWGLVGGIFIIILYLWLLQRSIRIVIKSPRAFGALLAAGLSIMIVLQAFIHMIINCGLGIVTGITLPFISMGGTSLIFMSIAIGIILSVSRNIEETEKALKAEKSDLKEHSLATT